MARIYIRGKVKEEQVGLLPQREDVLRYLHAQTLDGTLSKEAYDVISRAEYPSLQLLSKMIPDTLMVRILTIFFTTKYTKPVMVESRKLDQEDLAVLGERLRQFFKVFSLPDETLESVLASEFTVIKTRDEKMELHVPPQEAPVEE